MSHVGSYHQKNIHQINKSRIRESAGNSIVRHGAGTIARATLECFNRLERCKSLKAVSKMATRSFGSL